MPEIPLARIADEIQAVRAYQGRRAHAQYRADQFTPNAVAAMAELSRAHPWMDFGVAEAFAKEGVPLWDRLVQGVSDIALQQKLEDPKFHFGQQVKAGALTPGEANRAISHYTPRLQLPRDDEKGFVPITELPVSDSTRALINQARQTSVIDDAGFLHDPTVAGVSAQNPSQYVYRQVRDALLSEGFDVPFFDEALQARMVRYADPAPGTTNVLRLDERNPARERGYAAEVGSSARRAGMVPGVDPLYQQVIKPVVRGVGMVANYPLQEIQAGVRDVHALATGEGDWRDAASLASGVLPPPFSSIARHADEEESDLGITTEMLLRGKAPDLGTGLFVSAESEVARERLAREQEAGLIGGHTVTAGRWIASAITEPDTRPFNVMSGLVDMGVAIADPSALALGEIGRARQAADLFQPSSAYESAGVYKGLIPQIDGVSAQRFLDSSDGTRVVERLTGETSPYAIREAMGSKGKISPQVYARLAATRTTDETRMLINELVDTGQVQKLSTLTGSPSFGMYRTLNPTTPAHRVRLFDKMPGDRLDLQDPLAFGEGVILAGRNAKLPSDEIARLYDAAATAGPGSAHQLLDVAHDVNRTLSSHLMQEYGVPANVANEIVPNVVDHMRDIQASIMDDFMSDITADTPSVLNVVINGETFPLPKPHDLIEFGTRFVPLPDARAIRRLTTRYSAIFGGKFPLWDKSGNLRLPLAFIDAVVQEGWKGLQLLRGAWFARVLGEEQARMSAMGLDGLWTHPVRGLAWALGRKGTITPAGNRFEDLDEYFQSLAQAHSFAHRPRSVAYVNERNIVSKLDPHARSEYLTSWASDLAEYQRSSVYARLLSDESIEDTIEWLTNGGGQTMFQQMRDLNPGLFADQRGIRQYLEAAQERLNNLTQGNSALVDATRNGYLKVTPTVKHPLGRIDMFKAADRSEINPDFIQALNRNEFLNIGPERLIGREIGAFKGGRPGPQLFNTLLWQNMSRATNRLSRSPTFRQFMWSDTAHYMRFATAEARDQILANARKANLSNRLIRNLERSARGRPGNLSIAEVEDLAKASALDGLKSKLYDMSQRRQLFDVFRNAMPFGDAWLEVIQTWAKINRETGFGIGYLSYGRPARRVTQGVEALSEPGSSTIYDVTGDRHDASQGFFWKDQYGELKFTFPFSQRFTRTTLGVPIPLSGRVKGLNMFGEVIPGLGPVVTIPATHFLANKPAFDEVRRTLMPFGAPEGEALSEWTHIMPTWLRNFFQAKLTDPANEDRAYMRTVASTMNYLMSTGDYGNAPADLNRLEEDARKLADRLYIFNLITEFGAPTPPQEQWLQLDPSGSLIFQDAVVNEHRTFMEADRTTATARIIERYGPDAIGAVIPHSTAMISGAPVSREGWAWVRNHPGIKDDFSLTYGYFAPQGGELDVEAYLNLFRTGEREALTPAEHAQMVNFTLNMYWRDKALEELGVKSYYDLTSNQQDIYAQMKDAIDEAYPYTLHGPSEKPTRATLIAELERAVDDPRLQRTDAGQGLRLYLDARAQAQQGAEARGFSAKLQANALAPIRQWLREEADRIIERHPDFAGMWDDVFSRELREDTE